MGYTQVVNAGGLSQIAMPKSARQPLTVSPAAAGLLHFID